MNKLLFLLVILAVSCVPGTGEPPAIRIGNILVTPAEFEEAFSMSRFYNLEDEGKKEFIDTFVSRKLILKEAEKMGIDKDPQFLGDIQLFWEQALLKLAISRRMRELSLDINVSDREIRDYYEANRNSFGDKDIARVYNQIEWILFQDKQQKAVEGWVNDLRMNTKVVVDYSMLGLEE